MHFARLGLQTGRRHWRSTKTQLLIMKQLIWSLSTTKNVGEILSTSYASQKENNRCSQSYSAVFVTWGEKVLLYVGGTKTNDSTMRGEIDSNFMQLLRLHAEDSPDILKWIDLKKIYYTQHYGLTYTKGHHC